jgi:hypothetical protein
MFGDWLLDIEICLYLGAWLLVILQKGSKHIPWLKRYENFGGKEYDFSRTVRKS